MSNSDYVWAFDASALMSGPNGPFSLGYHLPSQLLQVPASDLPGSRLWLAVHHRQECFLYALITPSTLERYEDGAYQGDFLLTANPLCSVRLLPRREPLRPWRIPHGLVPAPAIRPCPGELRARFADMLRRNTRVAFAPPPKAVLDAVPRTKFRDPERAVPDQLKKTLNALSFGDVSRSRSFPATLSALAGVAFTLLQLGNPSLDESLAIELLAKLDSLPAAAAVPLKPAREIIRVAAALPPSVDMFLQELDPEKIAPRTFVAGAPGDPADWMRKTNEAEEAHERILKDLATRFREKGFKIFRSASFDLVAENANARLLWEVKSANSQNSVAQGEKGIVQLLRYAVALQDSAPQDFRFLLLLQDSAQRGVSRYLSNMAKRAAVEFWLYDSTRDWPHRVFNLEANTFPGL